jgi:RNA polymerase sigma-70 factor (ECF subfamily)
MTREPLDEAYDRHGAAIYRFLCGFLGNRDDAADALQNVFLQLAKRGLTGILDLRTYLWTAARNEARDMGPRRVVAYLQPSNGVPADPQAREAVEKALSSLPAEQREVVILHVLEGLTFIEMADLLGIPPDTAASRFRYAREKLRDIL